MNAQTLRSLIAVLTAVCVLATACGSTASNAAKTDDRSPAEALETAQTEGERVQVQASFDDLDLEDTILGDLEYGDSLDELHRADQGAPEPAPIDVPGFRQVDWDELVPPGFSGDEIYARYEDELTALEPGSPESLALWDEMDAEYDSESLNPQLDSEDIALAGFVAPLTYDGDRITEFLLVPYFGACIHVPPPPANQTIVVSLTEGESLTLEESWGAVWVAGTMQASPITTDLATAGYTISNAEFGVYETT